MLLGKEVDEALVPPKVDCTNTFAYSVCTQFECDKFCFFNPGKRISRRAECRANEVCCCLE